MLAKISLGKHSQKSVPSYIYCIKPLKRALFKEFVPEHGHERVHIDVAVELLVIAKAVVLIALGKIKENLKCQRPSTFATKAP